MRLKLIQLLIKLMTETYVRPQKISKTELLVTFFYLKKSAVN